MGTKRTGIFVAKPVRIIGYGQHPRIAGMSLGPLWCDGGEVEFRAGGPTYSATVEAHG